MIKLFKHLTKRNKSSYLTVRNNKSQNCFVRYNIRIVKYCEAPGWIPFLSEVLSGFIFREVFDNRSNTKRVFGGIRPVLCFEKIGSTLNIHQTPLYHEDCYHLLPSGIGVSK